MSATNARARALPALLLAALLLQCLDGARRHSLTYDEPAYLGAGLSSWATGDFRLKRDAPPMVPTLCALGLHALEPVLGPISTPLGDPSWAKAADYEFGEAVLRANAGRTRAIGAAARWPAMLAALVAALVVGRWAAAELGSAPAILAMGLACFDPNLIGHGAVLSTDVALAACFVAAHAALFSYLRAPGVAAGAAILAIAVALTIATKFTGLLLAPSFAVIVIWCWLQPPRTWLDARGGDPRAFRAELVRKAIWGAIGCAAATWVALCIAYRGLDGIERYAEGVRLIYANANPGYLFYLHGQFSEQPFPSYYWVALLVKTPLVTLASSAVGLVSLAVHPRGRAVARFVIVPVALVLAVCSRDAANLGIRRILLVFPFLFVAAGGLPLALASKPKIGAGLVATVLAVLGFGQLRNHPDELSYFNEFAGGPAGGPAWLDDSNLDWGQDLPALSNLLERRGFERVSLAYFGTDEPSRYGIGYRPFLSVGLAPAPASPQEERDELLEPRRDVYAISAQFLIRLRHDAMISGDPRLDWLSRFQPIDRAGKSIYVYDLRDRVAA